MSYLSVDQVRSLFNNLSSEYERLSETRKTLENDCTKLQEYIDAQIQQIQTLNADFEKLRQEYAQRKADLGDRMPEIPPPQPPAEEQPEQEWEVVPLVPVENIKTPVAITLLAEILDVSIICSTAFSPDDSCLAIGSDKTLRVYDIEKDDFIFQYTLDDPEKKSNHLRSIAWTSDGSRIMCGGENERITIFDPKKGEKIKSFVAGTGEVFQVKIAHDNSYFASVTQDGALSLWNTETFESIAVLKRGPEVNTEQIATSLAIFPDDKTIAVGYCDHRVVLWDVATKSIVADQLCHSQGVYSVKCIPGKPILATSSLDNTVKLWEVKHTGEEGSKAMELVLLKTLEGHQSYVLSLAVDPTGEWLLSGSKDLTARLSSVTDGEMLYMIKAHSNSIITVDFNNKGNMFCTGSGDQSVKIWTMNKEEPSSQ